MTDEQYNQFLKCHSDILELMDDKNIFNISNYNNTVEIHEACDYWHGYRYKLKLDKEMCTKLSKLFGDLAEIID